MNAPDTWEAIAAAVMETFREALHLEPPDAGVDLFAESGMDSLMFITFLDALEKKFAIRIELESIALEEI